MMTSIALFATILCVYVPTLYPSVPGGDSGELLAAVCQLGVAHPPGYPLWTMLSYVFVRVLDFVPGLPEPSCETCSFPIERNVAWRVNLSSAMYAALAATFVFKATRILTKRIDSALLSSLLYAFSSNNWFNATQAEVFSLNNMLCAALLWCAVDYFDTKQHDETTQKKAVLGSMIAGLCLSNQHTSIFFVVPVALAVLIRHLQCSDDEEKEESTAASSSAMSQLLKIGLGGLMTLILCYSYLPLTTIYNNPVESWGDHTTIEGFLTHVLRREYGTFQLQGGDNFGSTLTDFVRRLALYLQHLVREYTTIGVSTAMMLGVPNLLQKSRTRISGVLLLSCFVLYEVVMTYLSNMSLDNPLLVRGVYSRFWQQPDIIVCLWLGSGSSVIFEFISKLHETGTAISLACAILLGTSQCVRHWSESYHGDDFYTRRYGESLLYPLPYDAFVLLAGDLNHNSVKYLQRCEAHRLDVAAISPELMTYRWFKKSQIQHYRDVAYPGTHYHVNEEGGFHIANMIVGTMRKRLPFIAGSWKYGDRSGELMFDRVPFGVSDFLIPSSKLKDQAMEQTGATDLSSVLPMASAWNVNHASYAKRLYRASVPSGTDMSLPDVWGDVRHGKGTWDFVVAENIRVGLLRGLSHICTIAVNENVESDRTSLRYAYLYAKMTIRLIGDYVDDKSLPNLSASHFRNAGIVAGLASKYDKENAETDMFQWWEMGLKRREKENDRNDADAWRAIRHAVDHQINMYSPPPPPPNQ